MAGLAKGAMNLLGMGGNSRGLAAERAAQAQQQQVAQLAQANLAQDESRRSGEALGAAARRRRGTLLLQPDLGRASLA